MIEYLKKKGIIILDGATGTELEKRGITDPIIKANIDQPEVVSGLEKEYFDAGSDAVLTNTFTGSKTMLQLLGLDIDPYILNYTAAEIACKARPPGKLVIGSVGPSGKLLTPYGPLTESEAVSGFIPQLKGLIDGGVDAIVFETYMDLREMRCAITALKECGDIPFICSLTFEPKGKRIATLIGDTPEKLVELGISTGALAVGANCGVGIDPMIKIMESYRAVHPTIPLWAKPNAGMPKLVDGRAMYTESPEYFAAKLPELLQYNPSFIGGCCGTTPEHIERIRNTLHPEIKHAETKE